MLLSNSLDPIGDSNFSNTISPVLSSVVHPESFFHLPPGNPSNPNCYILIGLSSASNPGMKVIETWKKCSKPVDSIRSPGVDYLSERSRHDTRWYH